MPPDFSGLTCSAVMQDGALGFYLTSEGALTSPDASITYEHVSGANVLTMACLRSLLLNACSGSADSLTLTNVYTGAALQLLSNGDGSTLLDPAYAALQAVNGGVAAISRFGQSVEVFFDLSAQGLVTPYFSLQNATYIGQYGSLFGAAVKGGIITSLSGLAVPWSDVTATPTTLSGYGITNGLSTGTVFGGNVTGTEGALVVTEIDNSPVSISSPLSDEVLGYVSGSWRNGTLGSLGGLTTGYLFGGNVSGTGGNLVVTEIDNSPVMITMPVVGQILQYNGSTWVNVNAPSGSGGGGRHVEVIAGGGGAYFS
jgi:hypothetical protein